MRSTITAVFIMLLALTLSVGAVAVAADAPPIFDQKPGAVSAEALPAFTLRLRLVPGKNKPVPPTQSITYSFYGDIASATATGEVWGTPLRVEKSTYEKALGPHSYPNMSIKGFPVVLHLNVTEIKEATQLEAEATFDGQVDKEGKPIAWKMEGELIGAKWGMLVWVDKKDVPHVNSMAQYNRRFWAFLKGKEAGVGERPNLFPIVDRFITGDNDRLALNEGVSGLAAAGYSAIMANPDKASREALLASGNRRTAWAVYNPPGYAFDHDGTTPEALTKWAQEQAEPFVKAGFDKHDMSIYAIADETGWYYPQVFEPLVKNESALKRYRDYLQAQNLTPADVGHADWSTVLPIGRSKAVDLPSKKLFYWTMRFFPWDSARHFAAATKAMEAAFYPGIPVFDNWNFFAGRSYVPGPVANNNQKTNPDAAMGGHDWFEFARMRGTTMLWTEDWFGDQQAYQWSFYAAKMNSAARKGNIEFGGYVIPRTAGQRTFGLEQKILSIVGNGGKAIKYFVFGPEYNFPGNCYSMKSELLPKLADAHRMIGRGEPLLWPGRPPHPQVAILQPRSAEMWDAKNMSVPTMIQDATNNRLNSSTVDYMAEVFDLFLAFQHRNIAVGFVEEEDLSIEGLRGYKVLYITEPNVPAENQNALLEWVKQGGTVVTVPGAAMSDRYDEPCDILAEGTGITRGAVERLLIANTTLLPTTGDIRKGERAAIPVFGNVDEAASAKRGFLSFKIGGKPALLHAPVGRGNAYHFRFFPGLSYFRSGTQQDTSFPDGFDETLLECATAPALIDVSPRALVLPDPKKVAMKDVGVPCRRIETPMLVSDKGVAMTLLNWNNTPMGNVRVTVDVGFEPSRVESVKRGNLVYKTTKTGLQFSVPLDADDVVLIYRK